MPSERAVGDVRPPSPPALWRAISSRAGGWHRAWVIVMRCSAALSCPFPVRLNRCRARFDNKTGSGAGRLADLCLKSVDLASQLQAAVDECYGEPGDGPGPVVETVPEALKVASPPVRGACGWVPRGSSSCRC